MKLAFKIALRFLSSSKGQTALIALGIGIGISVQIFIGSLIEGLQTGLIDATIGRSSHITVIPKDKNGEVDQFTELSSWLMEQSDSITALTPTVTKGAFIESTSGTEQVLFRGFDMKLSDSIYKWSDALVEGKIELGDGKVIIGRELAESNQIIIGDKLPLITPEREIYEIEIVGIFEFKVSAIDKSWVIADISDAQTFFGLDADSATAIEMQIAEPFEAKTISDLMANASTTSSIKFDNWIDQNEQLLNGLNGQSSSSLMIQVFVLISVVLGIASVLAITVLQKSKQIGILKAMGITDRNSGLVFLFQGFILGFLGGIVGILLGIGLLYAFSTFALNADGTPVVSIVINVRFIIASGGIAVVSATLASLVPAIRSKNLSPIEVIRNG